MDFGRSRYSTDRNTGLLPRIVTTLPPDAATALGKRRQACRLGPRLPRLRLRMTDERKPKNLRCAAAPWLSKASARDSQSAPARGETQRPARWCAQLPPEHSWASAPRDLLFGHDQQAPRWWVRCAKLPSLVARNIPTTFACEWC